VHAYYGESPFGISGTKLDRERSIY